MAIISLNISLSAPAKAYMDATIQDGVFDTADQYIGNLILDDQARHQQAAEHHLLEALRGPSVEVPDEIWEKGDILAFLEGAHLSSDDK